MTSYFVARISNPGERFGKPFYEVDVPSPLISSAGCLCDSRVISAQPLSVVAHS